MQMSDFRTGPPVALALLAGGILCSLKEGALILYFDTWYSSSE